MDTTVQIAFDLGLAGQGTFFTLDDPAKGVLEPYGGLVVNDGAISHWRLDEQTGIIANNLIGTSDGIYRKSPELNAAPLPPGGNSASFNGSAQWVSVAPQTNMNGVTTDSWSVEAWFRCEDTNSASPQIIWEEGGDDSGVSLYIQGGDIYGLMWTVDTIRKQISTSVTSATAHHVVFIGTNTGNRCEIFLDGVSSASPTVNTATSLIPSVPDDPFLLDDATRGELDADILGGQDANGIARANGTTRSHNATVTNGWYFNGQIGDVARYDVGLTSEQVEAHYNTSRYVLGGDLLVDITSDVRAVNLRRGRSNETSTVDAGSGTITLDNRNRFYDPLASASVSPYAPSLRPRKEVTVDVGNRRQFTGIVEDWDLQYVPGGDSVTLVKLTDGLTLLNENVLASGAGATGLSGSVIHQTASAANWPSGRVNLDDGTETVGVHEISDNTNALTYMRKIAETEQALLFVGKDGTLRYRDRTASRQVRGTIFADDGTGIPFQDIEIIYGTELLYTQAEVEYISGSATATFVSNAAASAVSLYGDRSLSLDTFLSGSAPASGIANLLTEKYGEPTLRIIGLSVNMQGLPEAQRQQILNLELGDGVEVVFTPNGIGEPIYRELAVDSITHDITPGFHIAQISLYEALLLLRDGSASGSSSTAGAATGSPGLFGSAEGSSGTTGRVSGAEGNTGRFLGINNTAGTIVGFVGYLGVVSAVIGTDATATGSPGLSGSVADGSTTAGSSTGSPGFVGSASGSQGTAGSVSGAEGNVGTVVGSSSITGVVVGVIGFFGSAEGGSGTAGDVTGQVVFVGVITGSSGTAGTVTGTKATAFVLDTSELDGTDTLGG